MDLFQDLNNSGSTIIFITHDRKLAERASRVVSIDEGRLSAPSLRRAS
jgi:predicted ABC-type transport system involved in lysophospholipase L1 biosynthesis ATPase subunit